MMSSGKGGQRHGINEEIVGKPLKCLFWEVGICSIKMKETSGSTNVKGAYMEA